MTINRFFTMFYISQKKSWRNNTIYFPSILSSRIYYLAKIADPTNPWTALFETVIFVESLYNQFLRSHYFDNSMAKKLSHKNRLGWVKPSPTY